MSLNEEQLEVLNTIYARYRKDFPRWAVRSWIYLAHQAFETLKENLENQVITWDSPFFAFYSLCDWDWDAWSESSDWQGPSFERCAEALQQKEPFEPFSHEMNSFLYTDFLRRATFGAFRHEEANGITHVYVVIPEGDIPQSVQNIYDEMEADGIPPDLIKPFRFGVSSLVERFGPEQTLSIITAFTERLTTRFSKINEDSNNESITDIHNNIMDVEIDGEVQLERTDEAFLEDVLSFDYTDDETGQILNIKAVVELSPVFLEPHEKRASFPVVVGLEATEDGDPVSLATLPPEAHEQIWTNLFEVLNRIDYEGNDPLLDNIFEGFPGFGALTEKEHPTEHLPARTILDTPTREDSQGRAQLSKMHKVKLPKKWEKIPRWEDLTDRRIEAIKNEFGIEEGVKNKLLKVNRKGRKGGPIEISYELTKAESEKLRDSLGEKVFREERNDPGRGESLAIVKRIKTANGDILEVSFSWYGMDWKLVDGGRERAKEAFKGILIEDEQGLLFPKLKSHQRERLIRQIEHIEFLRDSERLMGLLVDRFGQKGSNVFSIPLWELKAFFEIERDPHALDRINGAFFCLTKLEFVLKQFGRNGSSGYGPFLVFYELPTKIDGDVLVEVSQWAIGALRVFEKGRKAFPYTINEKKLEDPEAKPSGEVVDYDFSRKLPWEQKKELSKALPKGSRITHKDTSINGHLVNALADGDERKKRQLSHLLDFMATELTRNKDPRRDRKQIDKRLDGSKPRLYDREFCPLLEDRLLSGALAHQKHSPESGRKLYGGSPQATSRSGASPEGLLSVLGFHETSKSGRKREIREALLLMVEVVEQTLGGLVALKNGTEWARVQEVIGLEEDLFIVGREYRVHLFFPENYVELLYERYHEYQAERAKKLKLPYTVKITKDRDLHRKNDLDRPSNGQVGEAVEERAAVLKRLRAITPLHERLVGARQHRNLTQKDVGLIFGVSAQTVKLWESYTKDDLGKIVKGRPISRELVPLVERWLEEKTAPTSEELSALKNRRPGRAQDASLE